MIALLLLVAGLVLWVGVPHLFVGAATVGEILTFVGAGLFLLAFILTGVAALIALILRRP